MTTPGRQKSLRQLAREMLSHVGEAGRLLALLTAEGAAWVLPRTWAFALCDLMGWLMVASPIGWRVVQRMGRLFPDRRPIALAHEWLSRSLRDHVAVTRLRIGRDVLGRDAIQMVGAVPPLGPNDPSLIIATGHFSREALAAMYQPEVVPELISVVAKLDFHLFTPKGLRLRLQFGGMKDAAFRMRGTAKVEFIEVGTAIAMVRLARRLREPGNFAIISADLPWTHAPRADRYERPFAGRGKQSFALGAARLARLGQCPVVTCVPFLDAKGRLGLEWGEPIDPPAKEDASADARVSDQILSRLEDAVGRRPGQYVLTIGRTRVWRDSEQRWRMPDDAVPPASGGRSQVIVDGAASPQLVADESVQR